jgi:hypothetical protein
MKEILQKLMTYLRNSLADPNDEFHWRESLIVDLLCLIESLPDDIQDNK